MVNAAFGTSATKCKRQRPAAELIVSDRARVADRFQARCLIAMITAPRFGSVFYRDQEPAPTRWTAPQEVAESVGTVTSVEHPRPGPRR